MKITFLGAGSTIFAKNILGDCILTPELEEFEIALFDIDEGRLNDSYKIITTINKTANGKASVKAYTDRLKALKGADFVINAIAVGGYKPSTVIDFEIPKKYGLKQTIGDTLGIGGIFRALRTIPVLEDFACDMEKVCPDALLINYSNPMSMLCGYLQNHTPIKTVGLCHSVQYCTEGLFKTFKMTEYQDNCRWEIAGINHMAWLLKLTDLKGNDLYPEIKRRSLENKGEYDVKWDLVRHELMRRFGYYVTESSEHNAEYHPYFIKNKYPQLIEKFNVPIDEYLTRCVKQIDEWNDLRNKLVNDPTLEHTKTKEFGSYIIRAMTTDIPYRIHGNVLNKNLITNLPKEACVEVPIMVDRNGLNPCIVGDLPTQCAALNRAAINSQLMTIQAAKSKKKDDIYMAAYLDTRTAAELSLDEIKSMCDDLIEAHGNYLPKYN